MHLYQSHTRRTNESSSKVRECLLKKPSSVWCIIYSFFLLLCTGDAADGMYFIEEGNVSIRLEQEGGEVEISVLGKGAYFGELALVTHRPRAASAYASENIKVACKSDNLYNLRLCVYLSSFVHVFFFAYGVGVLLTFIFLINLFCMPVN